MDRTLRWEIAPDGSGSTRVELIGELTENSNLTDLLNALSGKVRFDMAGVQRINSPGVREWIHFVNALDPKGIQFALERCSVAVVNQLNMISNFRGRGEIRSVLAPYYCEKCDLSEGRVIEKGPDAAAKIAEPMKCPRCGSNMEFDDFPEAFIAFWS